MEILNRKAAYDYFIEETYECGIVLTGTEIKSIRNGSANIKDSYGAIRGNELYLLNMFISSYKEGNIFNHDERATRKLLAHKSEILKMRDRVEKEGYTLIPLKLYIKRNNAKILIGVAKGKKNYDKRESIKQKDIEREQRRNL